MEGLYIHVPFCFHKCHYCDFYSLVESGSQQDLRHDRFVQRLIDELRRRAGQLRLQPRTIFVGGGTPTLLSPPRWRRLLEALQELGVMEQVEECTVEANPETVSSELLDTLVAGGVNRLSIGAQSFDPQALKTLERWHEPASVQRSVSLGRAAGILNLNLDLIFAIPGQQVADVERDLDHALALGPNHLSYYNLTYEPSTALTQRLKLGRIQPVEEAVEEQMFEVILTRLEAAGYEHYEISNWARREALDRRSQHNLLYWRGRDWLGVGPAAASHLAPWRWKNQPNLTRYLESEGEPPITDEESLPPDQRVGEQLMMALRLREGVERGWLEEAVPAGSPRAQAIDRLREMGMLETTATHLRLSPRGLFLGDAVMAELL